MAISIFPPSVESSQPAFDYNIDSYIINFQMPNLNSLVNIGHIQIRLVKQSNNQTVVKTNKYPDGIIYKDINEVSINNNIYSISINASDLTQNTWEKDTYYKVQLRFGQNALWGDDLSKFSSWKQEQIKDSAFSEWSTVMVIKSIIVPSAKIVNNTLAISDNLKIENMQLAETSLMPEFKGEYKCAGTELIDLYKFDLYNNNNELLETSGWLQHDSSNDSNTQELGYANALDTYVFTTILEKNTYYKVQYSARTENMFEVVSDLYKFEATTTSDTTLDNLNLTLSDGMLDDEGNAIEGDNDEGAIYIYISAKKENVNVNGSYVLLRSSENSNFEKWEDLKFFTLNNDKKTSLAFKDFTVESGVRYEYALQSINYYGLRSSPKIAKDQEEQNPIIMMIHLEHSYLYSDGVQLKLKYDNKMSSFKRNQLSTKQDSIGSKYPTLYKNGYVDYAEFPITGLISMHSDQNNNFFTWDEKLGYLYKGNVVIPKDKALKMATNNDGSGEQISIDLLSTNQTDATRYMEKRFRDKVIDFLTKTQYFLFRSATEGNFIVSLINTSFTPNEQLDRMIYSFTSTAYEMMDCTLENMDKYGIYNVGQYENYYDNTDNPLLIGQVARLIVGANSPLQTEINIGGQKENIIDIIAAQHYRIEGEDASRTEVKVSEITNLSFEFFPRLILNEEISYYQSLLASIQKGDSAEISRTECEMILNDLIATNKYSQYLDTFPYLIFELNGKEIVVTERTYHLNNMVLKPSDKLYLKYSAPCIINYTYKYAKQPLFSETVAAAVTSSTWGQLAGIFSESKEITDYYLQTETSMKVYPTLNIWDRIKDEVRQQVEKAYGVTFKLTNGKWKAGNIVFNFEEMSGLSIETDKATALLINGERYIVGPTSKYVLNTDQLKNIQSLTFEDAAYAIIDYKCRTVQELMGGE